jgi:hypothetical protein
MGEDLIPSHDIIYESSYTREMIVSESAYSWQFSQHLSVPLQEVSGIVSGRVNPELLYMHEDSGNRNVVFIFDTLGQLRGEMALPGAINRDWEDIAIGPGPIPGVSYIYIGDFGDNNAVRQEVRIYRFQEPVLSPCILDSFFKMVIEDIDVIHYQYPDGPRDAETLLVDPLTADLIIITKREQRVHVYELPYPQSTVGFADILFRGFLPFRWIVGGDISPDGGDVLIKDLGTIYYWQRSISGLVPTLFHTTPSKVAYLEELKGEAVGWSSDGQGYFTISEIDRWNVQPELRYYSK